MLPSHTAELLGEILCRHIQTVDKLKENPTLEKNDLSLLTQLQDTSPPSQLSVVMHIHICLCLQEIRITPLLTNLFIHCTNHLWTAMKQPINRFPVNDVFLSYFLKAVNRVHMN